MQKILTYLIPVGLFLLYFFFYNFGKFSSSEMIKTSGLLAISLLGITLIIGPLSRIFPALSFLKANRKFWGILSFAVAFIHFGLVFIFYYKLSFTLFVNFNNPKYLGFLSGLLALIILFLVTITSNQKAVAKLSPNVWKAIQTASYLALFLAVSHFYLMETVDGVLVIKRLLGRITFFLSMAVILLRVLAIFLPSKKMRK